MKKLLFILLPFILLWGCMTNSSPESEALSPEMVQEALLSQDIYVEQSVTYESDYSIPDEELLLSKFDHQHSFNDTIVIAQNYLINLGYNDEQIRHILVDSASVRSVIKENQELKDQLVERLVYVENADEEPDVILASAVAEEESTNVVKREVVLRHDHSDIELPPNALLFPNHETGYDWQTSDIELGTAIWVSVVIKDKPNKLGNYSYSVYMTSNTIVDNIISTIVVSNIDIKYFSHTEYINYRSNDKGLLQSKSDFKEQMTKEVRNNDNKEELLNDLDDYKQSTLIVSSENTLVYTFFLPDNESDIVISWENIKKLN